MGRSNTDASELGTRAQRSEGVCAERTSANPERRPIGGQASLGLFGIRDYDYRAAAAEAKASARQEGVVSEREAARRETAHRLREFRQALNAKLAAAQVQAPPQAPVEAAPERQLFGIARAVAEIPRNPRAAREAACQSVARSNRVREAFLAKGSPLTPEEVEAAANPQPAANPGAGIWASPKTCKAAALPPSTRRSVPLFGEEAEVEYEAHLAEVAEARLHQLDEETDRYACSFAGAGYTEYLMG